MTTLALSAAMFLILLPWIRLAVGDGGPDGCPVLNACAPPRNCEPVGESDYMCTCDREYGGMI